MNSLLASPITGVVCAVPLILLLTIRQIWDVRQAGRSRSIGTRWGYQMILCTLLCLFGATVLLRFLELSF